MDMLNYITKLQSLLKQHERAVTQIIEIEKYITEVSQQAYHAAMYGTSQKVMQLLLRKTVAEGVKKMYKQYRLRKWLKVQVMVNKRMTGPVDTLSDLREWNTVFSQYPDLNILEGADPMVQGWAVMHCEFSRYS